ncbi:MAG TPA: biosynthetic peptidoglycan transglycosylase [Gemmatimonadales bacterium]|nr:biosynthetic peptidoglycan transglycosylase [Gemmatimonadales bacterium]
MTIARKRTIVWRTASGLIGLGLVWLLGVWPPPVWWRDHWPEQTAMMRLRDSGGNYQPMPIARFPGVLQRMVIIGEDSRFRTHHGVDLDEIRDALRLPSNAGFVLTMRTFWRERDRVRGASTITQQLVKNLYLSPSRNPLRKVKEIVTALRMEVALPKDRILELYLNLVELGPGVWGVPAASQRYFGVAPGALSDDQAAALAATLPFPLSSNPAYRSNRMLHRRDLILARYNGVNVFIPPDEGLLDSLPAAALVAPVVPPVLDTLVADSLHVRADTVPADSTRDTTADSTRDSTP